MDTTNKTQTSHGTSLSVIFLTGFPLVSVFVEVQRPYIGVSGRSRCFGKGLLAPARALSHWLASSIRFLETRSSVFGNAQLVAGAFGEGGESNGKDGDDGTGPKRATLAPIAVLAAARDRKQHHNQRRHKRVKHTYVE